MKALLLQIIAPMQAWGVDSRFSERDTLLEPTKSGVIGLLAAALGRPRSGPFDDLNALRMGVRVDREGLKMCDYHTVGGGKIPAPFLSRYGVKNYGVSRASGSGTETALSRRYYLADARFLVALAGEDIDFLEQIVSALRDPVFPLFLGRKAFVPSEPLLFDAEFPIREDESLLQILEDIPWRPDDQDLKYNKALKSRAPQYEQLRLVLEVGDDEVGLLREDHFIAERLDSPLSFIKTDRRFRKRYTRTLFTDKPIQRWQDEHLPKEETA
jgi:CRISPR system Cascade subunit CasD